MTKKLCGPLTQR